MKKHVLRLASGSLAFAGMERPFGAADDQVLKAISQRYQALARRGLAEALAEVGRALYDWLDGSQCWGEALKPAASLLQVSAPPKEVVFLNAPWELLCGERCPKLEVVRVPDDPGLRVDSRSCSRNALSLLFMAAAPEGEDRLRFEEEEATILKATRPVRCDLFVEETGTVKELGFTLNRLRQVAPIDVLHLTCHGGISEGEPLLLFEDEQGQPAPCTAAEFGEQIALNEVGLLVASACQTAQTAGADDSLALALLRHGARAVLGWASSVSDQQASQFATALYGSLAQGTSPVEAVRAGRSVLRGLGAEEGSDWHLARLFSACDPRNGPLPVEVSLATNRGPQRRAPDEGLRDFLDQERRKFPVASREAFVGRRRELQRALRAVLSDERVGLLILGLGHQGKSSLAARLVSRLETHRTVVCYGADEIRSAAILRRVAETLDGTLDSAVLEAVLDNPARLTGELISLLRHAETPVLLVLDDVEQILDLTKTPVCPRDPRVGGALAAVIRAFDKERAANHRLILTCRVNFVVPDGEGRDLVARRLFTQALHGMSPRELALLPAAAALWPRDQENLIERCLAASQGNPGLAGRLLILAREALADGPMRVQAEESLKALLTRLGQAPTGEETIDEWMADCVEGLFKLLNPEERELLEACQLLPAPVARVAVEEAFEAPAALSRLCDLQLLETHPRKDAVALRLEPLAAARLPKLPDKACWALAARLVASINRLAPPEIPLEAWHLFWLARLIDDHATCEAWAEAALRFEWDRLEIDAARDIARYVLSRVEAGSTPPVGATLIAAETLEGVTPEAAHRLLEVYPHEPAALLGRGRLLRREGYLEQALDCFKRGIELTPGPREKAILRGEMAYIHEQRGELDEALRIRVEEELPIYEQLEDLHSLAGAKGAIATILKNNGEVEQAIIMLKNEVIPLFEAVGDTHEVAINKGHLADILFECGRYNEAMDSYINEQLPTLLQLDDQLGIATTKGRIADILEVMGKFDEALHIRVEEELPTYIRLSDKRSEAKTRASIANVYKARGDLDMALRILEQDVLPIYDMLQDKCSIAVAKGKISDVLVQQGKLQDALALQYEVLPIFIELGNVSEIAVTKGKIADIFLKNKQYKEALSIYQGEVLPRLIQLKDTYSIAQTQSKIAGIFRVLGKVELAIPIWRLEVLPVFEALEAIPSLIVGRINLGFALAGRGQPQDRREAASLLSQAYLDARRLGLAAEAATIEGLMVRFNFSLPQA